MKVYTAEQIKEIENLIIKSGYGSIHRSWGDGVCKEISFKSRFHTLSNNNCILFRIRHNYYSTSQYQTNGKYILTYELDIFMFDSHKGYDNKHLSLEQFLDILIPYVKRRFIFNIDLFEGVDA